MYVKKELESKTPKCDFKGWAVSAPRWGKRTKGPVGNRVKIVTIPISTQHNLNTLVGLDT